MPLRPSARQHRRWWTRGWVKLTAVLCLVSVLALVIAAEYVLHNAEPILRKRVIQTLSDRFDAPVELDSLNISLFHGIEVSGYGLRIPFSAGLQGASDAPVIAVQHFAFRTSWRNLLHGSTHVPLVRVDGMDIHIPPPALRKSMFGTKTGRTPVDPLHTGVQSRQSITVDELLCRDVELTIESGKPGRDPLVFHISALTLNDAGAHQAMRYDAQLTNPKPAGFIHATGHFGPWAGQTETAGTPPDPGQTPIDGRYTFDHADLNTIKGLGGFLSSTGQFTGVLDRMTVDGTTDTPDFSLDISHHAVPLHTEFHAIVDGTNGDTWLQPVHAKLANSEFTTSGHVIRVKGQGHDIQLDVQIPNGHMEDFLRLAVKTSPPVMNGVLSMKAKLHIPPGPERVPLKMAMQGSFGITGVRLNNARWQDRIDGLSARAQSRPRDVAEESRDRETQVHSQMTAAFSLSKGIISLSDLHYLVPGATVLLNGVYSMDGKLFEFKGHVRTQATASQMVTGWKSLLLKPVDPFLRKNGAGVELPVEFSGTEGDLHIGLAMKGVDDSPAQLLADVREKDQNRHAIASARRESKLADAEDAKAAKAVTLEDAERAHHAAVLHRNQAKKELDSVKKDDDARH